MGVHGTRIVFIRGTRIVIAGRLSTPVVTKAVTRERALISAHVYDFVLSLHL